MQLVVLPDKLAVCRLLPSEDVPAWVWREKSLVSITYTVDELSIVCASEHVPDDVQCERGWRAMKVQGPLDFSLTGILAAIAAPLAGADIAIFALSTYDTDYILVKEDTLQQAVTVLRQYGHVFEEEA
ncbi:MAG TPA: ACT domain-containing protein [Ktedonobacteraceae bacterium]|nr:ACT domain-containing protein [Ktedonobacteraceae bacterium]